MKRVRVVTLLITLSPFTAHTKQQDIELTIESQWHNLDTDRKQCEKFGAWIDAGVITVKKRTKEPINLTHLILRWQGSQLEQLIGSLYQRKSNKEFLPLEQNLICDSHWHKSSQKLIFKFDHPLSLDSLTELHLVLTVPLEIEGILKNGSLKVEADYLPDQMRQLLQQQPITLTFNAVQSACALS